jgi:hypothetical protein
MSKRTRGKQITDGEADRESREGAARAAESNAILARKEDKGTDGTPTVAEIGKLDLAATVGLRPLILKSDTREKLLYKVACAGAPLGNEFFDQFPDMKEILELSLVIAARLMVVAACNTELVPTQRIAAIRVLASLAGKQIPEEEEDSKFKAAPPLAVPRGSKEEVSATLEKIRQLSS